jgi:aldehyde oxidoreductase
MCGNCTVIVTARRPFLPEKDEVMEGATVQTVEGISDGNTLHPVQTAFLINHSYQCGFCTPGVIMAVKALLDENPHPTDEEIKKQLKNNICRCTGYKQIVDAVHTAVKILDGELPNSYDNGNGWVGESPITKGGVERVTGTLIYADDIHIDDELEGRVMFAAYPHANIRSIDVSGLKPSRRGKSTHPQGYPR